MTRNRDIAKILGRTEANNITNVRLFQSDEEVGLDSSGVTLIVDSDYVQTREDNSGAGLDSALTVALIESTVDSDYVQLREASDVTASGGTTYTFSSYTVHAFTSDQRLLDNSMKLIFKIVYFQFFIIFLIS